MLRQRRTAAVLRPLRGEDLETVSRGLGVTAAPLTGWRDAFPAAGEASLSTRPKDGDEVESDRLKAKLGAMLLERDLLEAKIAILEAGRPLAVEAMTASPSPSSGKPYGLARICRVWGPSRATVYRRRDPAGPEPRRRPGEPRSEWDTRSPL